MPDGFILVIDEKLTIIFIVNEKCPFINFLRIIIPI